VKRRDYGEHCGIARALDVVGERWTLLIVRELLTGPKRFTDLAERFPVIGRNLLTERLRQLEADGLVQRSARRYELTELGHDLRPVLDQLAIWGMKVLEPYPSGREFSVLWATLSMRAAGDPRASRDMYATIAFTVDEERFTVTLDDGEVGIEQGPPGSPPDLTVTCTADAYLAVAIGSITVQDGVQSGLLVLQGKLRVLDVCFRALRLPPYPAMEARLHAITAGQTYDQQPSPT
jgi:DNA-binding HxlR family transcriptional regulator